MTRYCKCCGRPARGNRCSRCAASGHRSLKAYRARKREAGLCQTTGCYNPTTGSQCEHCRRRKNTERRLRRAGYRAAGRCRCGNSVVTGRDMCYPCIRAYEESRLLVGRARNPEANLLRQEIARAFRPNREAGKVVIDAALARYKYLVSPQPPNGLLGLRQAEIEEGYQ